MTNKISSKIKHLKTVTYAEKKEKYLEKQLNQSRVQNKGLLHLARQYVLHSQIPFDESNPLLNLCNYHNMNPRALNHLNLNGSADLVRQLHSDIYKVPNKTPREMGFLEFNIEETLHKFKLLKLASELDEMDLEITRQNFYNIAKAKNLIQNSTQEKLFMDLTDNLTGNTKYFPYQLIDKTQKQEFGKFNYIDTTQ